MRYFYLSHAVTIIGLILAYRWAGFEGLVIAFFLMVMEITLSFDNAVVNATVLKKMDKVWQRRFLTWGILIAVFGMRLLFPLLIVALAADMNMWEVVNMALDSPDDYKSHVMDAHISIASFGGMFLLMVFLKFILDAGKDLHWIGFLESRLSMLGKLEAIEIIVALLILLLMQTWLPEEHRSEALVSGIVGVVLYVITSSVTALFAQDTGMGTVAYSGFTGFMYLQFLDASFSLDGVIGAFAISKDIVIIMIGLGIGAMFVRSLTVYLVEKGTLDEYVFLEHGAHYGVGALAGIMLTSMVYHVPEVVTGFIGVGFIVLSFFSSVRYKRRQQTL